MSTYWPESAVREVAILNEALDNATAEVERLREQLRAAVEEVEANVQVWEELRAGEFSAEAKHAMLGLWIREIRAALGAV